MPTHGSARSVYSTASHLLSPQTTDASSPARTRSPSVSSSRYGTPLPHLNRPSSSIYPTSQHSSSNSLDRPTTGSRRSTSRRKSFKPRGRDATSSRNARRHTNFLANLFQRTKNAHGDPSAAPVLSGLSSPSRAHEARKEAIARTSEGPFSHRGSIPAAEPFSPLHWEQECLKLLGSGRKTYVDDGSSSSHGQDTLNEIIMAIDVDKDGKIGCAYYVAMEEQLVLEEDIAMGGIEAVDTILLQVQPTSVIVPNRAPGDLVEFLERDAHRFDDSEGSSNEQGSYILRHVVTAQFDYEAAKEALAHVGCQPSEPDPVEILSLEDEPAQSLGSAAHVKLMRLAASVNLESCLSVGCAGAVLNDLERRRAVEDSSFGEASLDGDGNACLRVVSIQMNTSADTMLISADALISLQILQSELHPNPQTRSSNSSEPKAKEALSVTGLLQALASSAQGKKRLRQMLLRPTTNLDLIQERHMCIEVLMRAENSETVKNMRRQLRKLKNIKTLLLHVRKGVDRVRGQLSVRVGDWKALLRFAMVAAQLRQATRALKGCSGRALFMRICDEIDVRRFLHLGDIIIRTIDFQLSKETGRTEIHVGASEYLDGLRREFADVLHMLPELKESVVRDVPRAASQHIRHCTVMPQLGFLIAVTLDVETGEGVYHGQHHHEGEWAMCFNNEDIAYYKNQLMVDLDTQYGDLPSRIADEEIEVIVALAASVLEHEEEIISASELFSEFDSLLALALAAEKYNWAAPTMTASNVVDIVDGRHPLQELLVPAYIPNDCHLAGGDGAGGLEGSSATGDDRQGTSPSMLILTGPNNSGKSVYMRQVALIVYLAHTGSYVPATRATIGVTDRILTRIATRETVVNDESAFLVDLKQAAFSMNFATRRSLLLIDEFGKGTTAESGSALFAAYLSYFLDLGAERPKLLAGTHFHEVFDNGLLVPGREVAFAHMEVRLDPENEEPEERITFLFHLLPGRGSSSLGVLCAAINDVPSQVIKRAEAIVALQDRNESLVEACADFSERDKKGLEQAELVARRFLALQVTAEGSGEGAGAPSIRDMLRSVLATEDEAGRGL